ncbi:rhamnogalacturonidase [Undibacterium sp. Ji83W]|uniref:rhamnogalacturonidase n=1 Tax=Undibacterium sp. Ji83W TaxID=3413043 RepID=UPI003BEFDAAD
MNKQTSSPLRRGLLRMFGTGALVATLPMYALPVMAQGKATANTNQLGNFNVRGFGASGNGKKLDTDAINRAIKAAAAAGGGTVYFPAGKYLSFSIRLQSHVTLYLDAGATLIAADPAKHGGSYDEAEPNEWDAYQDFGHSHWHNSLIWGENLEHIAILGSGLIYGAGLTHAGPGPRRTAKPGDMPLSLGNSDPHGERGNGKAYGADMVGKGNKAIALKNCKNIILRDISIFNGGHFALLATAADNMTIDNLKVDTDRDGFDIDCCRNVHISNCSINSPNDDAICLKSSYALGYKRFTENISITNCQVSGFDLGTFLDGSFQRKQEFAPDKEGVAGRIKLGTESNGGFRNIAISNCVFERCRGLAIESVDGAIIEDISVNNLTMRDLTNPPIFIRLGSRLRAPDGATTGAIRRINISNVTVSGADSRYASIISGVPGYPIEDVRISNLHVLHQGGGDLGKATANPPENAGSYPEPSMFGLSPAHALFARHVNNLELHHVDIKYAQPDSRPAFVLHDVSRAYFGQVNFPQQSGTSGFNLQDVKDFSVKDCSGMADIQRKKVEREIL